MEDLAPVCVSGGAEAKKMKMCQWVMPGARCWGACANMDCGKHNSMVRGHR